jgi:hypothetical protein
MQILPVPSQLDNRVIAEPQGACVAPGLLHGDYIGCQGGWDMPGKMHESNGKYLFSA